MNFAVVYCHPAYLELPVFNGLALYEALVRHKVCAYLTDHRLVVQGVKIVAATESWQFDQLRAAKKCQIETLDSLQGLGYGDLLLHDYEQVYVRRPSSGVGPYLGSQSLLGNELLLLAGLHSKTPGERGERLLEKECLLLPGPCNWWPDNKNKVPEPLQNYRL